MPPAIVLGLDRMIGLTIVRELGMHGVGVIGVGRRDALAVSSRYLTRFVERPVGAVREWLPELVREHGAGAVLAMAEGDLKALAELDEWIEGARVLTPRAEPLARVLDKARTLAAASVVGIETPRSWQPGAFDEAAPDLGWPVVLKWADRVSIADRLASAGLRMLKAEYCTDAASLCGALARYEAVGEYPLVQEYCRGHGLGHMLYMDGGRAGLRFQHERLHEWPPEGGVSTLCRALPLSEHAGQMERSEALLAALGWEGPAMVEYRYDRATGRYLLMEVNGRFWGSQPLATACGAHFAWELYRRRILGEADPPPPPRSGIRARQMVRETRRLGRVFRPGAIKDPAYRRTPLRDLARYVGGFLDPRTRYFVFAWRDPKPFLAEIAGEVRSLLRKRKR
ncbi:MAG TPA: carboxylate--amine ligase [Allosphingosinicella sp.]|jgi:predicted ATP-grasp superfamily ATP-dependent carboligase